MKKVNPSDQRAERKPHGVSFELTQRQPEREPVAIADKAAIGVALAEQEPDHCADAFVEPERFSVRPASKHAGAPRIHDCP